MKKRLLKVGMINIILLHVFCFSSCKKEEHSPVPSVKLGAFTQGAPQNYAVDVSNRPTLTWVASEGAASYTVTLSTKSDFSVVELEQKNITATQFQPETTLKDGFRYYWKVTAVNGSSDQLADNAGIYFRTKGLPPSASPGVSTYYVSPQGEDNPDQGTLEHPFKTLAYAAGRVPAGEGDTISLSEGTFTETAPAIIPLGVNVVGKGEGVTILSSAGVTVAAGIDTKNKDYKLWYDGSLIQLVSPHRKTFRNNSTPAYAPAAGNQSISNFSIDGNDKKLKAGVWVENRNNVVLHHITFTNLQQRGAVLGCGDKDFYVYPEFYMTGIKVYDCTFENSGKDLADETLGNLDIAQLDGAEIYNIKIQDNEGYGIKFIYDGYFKNLSIHDCQMTLNESDAKWGEDIAIELWNLGPGNKIKDVKCNTWLSLVNHPDKFATPVGTENAKVSGITMIDTDGESGKESIEVGAPGIEVSNSYFENKGIGMAIWDMGRSNITIRNNIFYNSTAKVNWASGAAIYIDNSHDWEFQNISIVNNIFDTHLVSVEIKGAKISGISIENNAFLNSSQSDIETSSSQVTLSNNLKYSPTSSQWVIVGSPSQANNIVGNPGFNNTGARNGSYYKPASAGSAVVDKGIDTGLPFNGLAPDIGAIEF